LEYIHRGVKEVTMSEPFIAEIKIWAGNFAPRGYAYCDGQLLPISQNTALFSLIGTIYGGDGRTTTALPNLMGRAPMHPGRGPGLTQRRLGERTGTENVTLNVSEMPSHSQSLVAETDEPGEENDPSEIYLAQAGVYAPAANLQNMHGSTLDNQGSGDAHNNMQPYLALSFIIAVTGIYPSR
jgi:microcystin-dependent protein